MGEMAKVEDGKPPPSYDEVNIDGSESAFDWKAFAIQHACMETFRRDGDAIAKNMRESFHSIRTDWSEDADEKQKEKFLSRVAKMVGPTCMKARACKAQKKLERKVSKGEL